MLRAFAPQRGVKGCAAFDTLPARVGGGATWWLPFTREAAPQVLIAEGKLIAVRPDEVE